MAAQHARMAVCDQRLRFGRGVTTTGGGNEAMAAATKVPESVREL